MSKNNFILSFRPERENEDPLTLDKKRLARYQAFSNPAHICHVSSDPILKAFQLSVELDRAAVIQRELHKSYRQLSQVFLVKILPAILHVN